MVRGKDIIPAQVIGMPIGIVLCLSNGKVRMDEPVTKRISVAKVLNKAPENSILLLAISSIYTQQFHPWIAILSGNKSTSAAKFIKVCHLEMPISSLPRKMVGVYILFNHLSMRYFNTKFGAC